MVEAAEPRRVLLEPGLAEREADAGRGREDGTQQEAELPPVLEVEGLESLLQVEAGGQQHHEGEDVRVKQPLRERVTLVGDPEKELQFNLLQ